MKIAFFEAEDWEKESYREKLSGHELSFVDDSLRDSNVAEAKDAEAAVIFVFSRITSELLNEMPNLKVIATRSMGYDHIDLEACKERGITVCRVPSYGERTVAEHAIALLLALSRRIFTAYERTEKKEFDYSGLMGFDLYGKTLGIFGGGKIGVHVARIARAFGMEVLVYDPKPNEDLAKEVGFSYVSFDEMLGRSDAITLHAPLIPQTEHALNEEAFSKIKKGALIVNTARGGLIDTKALLVALESGQVSGAGLDVLEGEYDIKEESELLASGFAKKCDLGAMVRHHLLIERDDVIITPHIGWYSKEATERIVEETVRNLEEFAKGEAVNVV